MGHDARPGALGGRARSATPRPLVDGDVRLTFAELADGGRRRRAGVHRRGDRAGRPRGDLVAQRVGVGRRRARAAVGRRRGRADQHPLQGRRGGVPPRPRAGPASSSPSTASSATTTSACSTATTCRTSSTPSCSAATCPPAPPSWADFLAGGDAVDPAEVDARRGRARPPTTCPTSSSRSGTTGNPKGVGVHPRPGRAGLRRLGGRRRAPPRRPLPRDQPVLPRLRVQGRDHRLPHGRRHARTRRAVFDIPTAMANVAEHQITMLPGPPAMYQTFLNHPDVDLAKHAVAAARGHRRRAPCPVELIERMKQELGFETVVTGYGLTESLRDRRRCAATTTPPRRSAPRSGRAIPGVEVRVVDDDGARGAPRRARRGRRAGLQRDAASYFEDPEQTAEVDRRRRLAAHGRHRHDGRATATSSSPTARRTCSSPAASTPTRPRSSGCSSSTRTSPRSAVIGVPDERMGEVGMAFVVPAAGADARRPTRSWPGPASTMANFKVAAPRPHRRGAADERQQQGAQDRAAGAGRRRETDAMSR